MSESMRSKLLLAVLGALVLGAGAYILGFRGSPEQQAAARPAPSSKPARLNDTPPAKPLRDGLTRPVSSPDTSRVRVERVMFDESEGDGDRPVRPTSEESPRKRKPVKVCG